ncbi:MAG: hypothetical protein D6798_04330 [Deltaproteobacteria bacterium]|nr:MAG: hypothetical protein D6798_04330 [Deltaproteobacteria bacterium]
MIRDRLKKAARRAAIKLLHMEFDVEDRDPAATTRGTAGEVDMSVIPKIVDGAGDTPGPNHKADIGRTWVAAQLVAGVAPVFVDIRPPAEVVAGALPGAIFAPGTSILDHPELLPAHDVRVTVYDQTGEQGSAEVAAALRAAGWTLARRLQGGYAEWLEHGEPVETPTPDPASGRAPGSPVELADGRRGHVIRTVPDGVVVWVSGAPPSEIGPLDADALVG